MLVFNNCETPTSNTIYFDVVRRKFRPIKAVYAPTLVKLLANLLVRTRI